MLVLSRRKGEQIQIGDHVKVTVVRIQAGKIRLGIDAPDDAKIRRVDAVKMEASHD